MANYSDIFPVSGGSGYTTVNLPYTAYANLDGLFNYLGTNYGQSSWQNPYPSKVAPIGSRKLGVYSNNTGLAGSILFDKTLLAATNYIYLDGSTVGDYLGVTFKGKIKPTHLFLSFTTGVANSARNIEIYGEKDFATTSLGSASFTNGSSSYLYQHVFSITTSLYFDAFRFYLSETPGTFGIRYTECEVWGEYVY